MPVIGVVVCILVLAGALSYAGLRGSDGGTATSSGAAVGTLLGTNAQEGLGRLEGVMTITLCTKEESGPQCNPSPEIFALHKVYLLSEDEELYTLIPDKDGNFSVMLPPGTYVADVEKGLGSVKGVPAAVIIGSGEVATLLINIDASAAH